MCDLYLGPPRKTEIPDFYKRKPTNEQEIVEVYNVVIIKTTNMATGKERVAHKQVLLGRATYSKPEPEDDLSFSTRYAYDKVNLLNRDRGYLVSYQNQRPEYPPWRDRFEQWLLDPQISRDDDEVIEDNQPHYLLQDQAGYTDDGINENTPYCTGNKLVDSTKMIASPLTVEVELTKSTTKDIEGKGPAPYPREIILPVKYVQKIEEKNKEVEPIVIEMPFLNDHLQNHDCCMDDHHFHCSM